MYEAFYGFRHKPFSLTPDPDFLYLSKRHEIALGLLEYSVMEQTPFSVITGDIGTGKTTLIRHLLNRVGPDVSVGLITNTQQSFGELLQWVLLAFDLDYRNKDKSELYQTLVDHLIAQYAQNRRTLLIFDEAQNMSGDTLEELRMLSNLNADKYQVLQVILVGQVGLRDTLRRPDLEQFAQRIGVDYHLEPLDREETHAYIRHRLQVAGGKDPELFGADACDAVFRYSSGIPRLVNLLCDTALVYAFAEQRQRVDAALIDEVAHDKQRGEIFPLRAQEQAAGEEVAEQPADAAPEAQKLPSARHVYEAIRRHRETEPLGEPLGEPAARDEPPLFTTGEGAAPQPAENTQPHAAFAGEQVWARPEKPRAQPPGFGGFDLTSAPAYAESAAEPPVAPYVAERSRRSSRSQIAIAASIGLNIAIITALAVLWSGAHLPLGAGSEALGAARKFISEHLGYGGDEPVQTVAATPQGRVADDAREPATPSPAAQHPAPEQPSPAAQPTAAMQAPAAAPSATAMQLPVAAMAPPPAPAEPAQAVPSPPPAQAITGDPPAPAQALAEPAPAPSIQARPEPVVESPAPPVTVQPAPRMAVTAPERPAAPIAVQPAPQAAVTQRAAPPAAAPESGTADSGKQRVVVVKPGDSLSSIIIDTYGTYDLSLLRAVLRKNPHIRRANYILVGQVVTLPER